MIRKGRKTKHSKSKSPKLHGNPQLRGIVLRTMALDPKKPNSAKRHCARVRLSNGLEVTCYVPGRGMDIQEHNVVLVRGGRTPDLPGVKYRIVRGTRDCGPVDPEVRGIPRKRSRSLYGVKK